MGQVDYLPQNLNVLCLQTLDLHISHMHSWKDKAMDKQRSSRKEQPSPLIENLMPTSWTHAQQTYKDRQHK